MLLRVWGWSDVVSSSEAHGGDPGSSGCVVLLFVEDLFRLHGTWFSVEDVELVFVVLMQRVLLVSIFLMHLCLVGGVCFAHQVRVIVNEVFESPLL